MFLVSLTMGQDHFLNGLAKNGAYFCILKVPDIHVLMNFSSRSHYSLSLCASSCYGKLQESQSLIVKNCLCSVTLELRIRSSLNAALSLKSCEPWSLNAEHLNVL